MKKIIKFCGLALFLIGSLALTACSCGKEEKGSVYYLNFKPEQDEQWKALAKTYTEQKGIEVKVVTAASGTYEETLTAEIGKTSAPTLFQINGPVGYQAWKEYALDLTDSAVYKELTSDDFAIKDQGKVYGIAYVYETYGIIVNKDLLNKAGYKVEDIKSLAKFEEVCADITSRKATLGFSAFTSSGLAASSSWRFAGHLANVPLQFEFDDDNIKAQPATIKLKYKDNLRRVWDMYIENSTTAPDRLDTELDAKGDFVSKKAVFYQNGTWEYDNIKSIGDENIGFLPIYMGIDDEHQGLCSGTENYWVVNKEASKADQKATLDFLHWVTTSDEGVKGLYDMGFVSPFKKAKTPANALAKIATEMVNSGKKSVKWEAMGFTPNTETWRAGVVTALTTYSKSQTDDNWQKVVDAFVDGWKNQYNASHN